MFEKHAIWEELCAQTNTFPWYNFGKKGFFIELIKLVLLIVEKGFPCKISEQQQEEKISYDLWSLVLLRSPMVILPSSVGRATRLTRLASCSATQSCTSKLNLWLNSGPNQRNQSVHFDIFHN